MKTITEYLSLTGNMTSISEALFKGTEFYKHNYLNDVIDTLCNKSSIRLGKEGNETFTIDPTIQQSLKMDFTSIGSSIDVEKFNEICTKYGLPKWTQIFKGNFSGYSNGLASKNQGNAFEIDYVNNFESIYQDDFEKKVGVKLGNCQITLEGGQNTKRPLRKGSRGLYLGTENPNEVGAMLKDAFIRAEDGSEYNVSLKTSETVSFINTGVKELFPEKIFKEYEKTGVFEPQTKNGVNGQDILDMFGIDGVKMAEVFNKYNTGGKRSRSVKNEVDVLDIVKKNGLIDLMKTVVGCNYILVHKIKNVVHTYDLRTIGDMNKFIGTLKSAKVLYPTDGKAKRIDVKIETTNLKLKFNIRAKDGTVFPTHMQCDYEIKH